MVPGLTDGYVPQCRGMIWQELAISRFGTFGDAVSIIESLSASLIQWLKNGGQVEAGMLLFPSRYHTNPGHLPDVWPAHKPDMARLVHLIPYVVSSCMMI
jgi:hypothetical protein